jgi:hypothetical protein
MADTFAFAFEHHGTTYRVYRGAEQGPEVTWRVMRGPSLEREDEFIAEFLLPVAISEAEIKSRTAAWLRTECFGGPLDGERVGDRGAVFRGTWEWVEDDEDDAGRRVSRPQPGEYRRSERGYEWHEDVNG